jgi:hypothetical protein
MGVEQDPHLSEIKPSRRRAAVKPLRELAELLQITSTVIGVGALAFFFVELSSSERDVNMMYLAGATTLVAILIFKEAMKLEKKTIPRIEQLLKEK